MVKTKSASKREYELEVIAKEWVDDVSSKLDYDLGTLLYCAKTKILRGVERFKKQAGRYGEEFAQGAVFMLDFARYLYDGMSKKNEGRDSEEKISERGVLIENPEGRYRFVNPGEKVVVRENEVCYVAADQLAGMTSMSINDLSFAASDIGLKKKVLVLYGLDEESYSRLRRWQKYERRRGVKTKQRALKPDTFLRARALPKIGDSSNTRLSIYDVAVQAGDCDMPTGKIIARCKKLGIEVNLSKSILTDDEKIFELEDAKRLVEDLREK